MLRQLIEFAIKQIVLNPNKVSISETIDGSKCAVEIRVASEDIGKVIGKEGRTIKALRMMAIAIAADKGMEAVLDVVGA